MMSDEMRVLAVADGVRHARQLPREAKLGCLHAARRADGRRCARQLLGPRLLHRARLATELRESCKTCCSESKF
eukprot:6186316-Pleurochrysis_carterae.AAC.2